MKQNVTKETKNSENQPERIIEETTTEKAPSFWPGRGGALKPEAILAMQQTVGNRVVTRMLKATIQRDPVTDLTTLESEADKLAGKENPTLDGEYTCDFANTLGAEWCKAEYTQTKYGPPFGFQYKSNDGLRGYRAPMVKQSGVQKKMGVCNFELYNATGKKVLNMHMVVNDIGDHLDK